MAGRGLGPVTEVGRDAPHDRLGSATTDTRAPTERTRPSGGDNLSVARETLTHGDDPARPLIHRASGGDTGARFTGEGGRMSRMVTGTMVRVEDVHKSYGTGAAAVHALRGVSFDVPRGELVAL